MLGLEPLKYKLAVFVHSSIECQDHRIKIKGYLFAFH
ncbi:Hypothetical protein Minf_0200 [Methylacidiphilum infernorum V4]|uniref:Uncharacterized protein n=1 Tax=Methylacidiphilum infernorum (isolate V4) TaxID=481448 RepID=B3DXM6_METI4|nr:Hypothetical protein Minf_0200 [Methylacidiphilum infernorum V4]